MKNSLLRKLIIIYALSSIILFAAINIFGTSYIQRTLINDKKNVLYEEAAIISSNYMSNYYKDQLSLTALNTQLNLIDTFLNSRIWIVGKDGTIILDTRDTNNTICYKVNINELDADFLYTTFSENVTFPGILNEEMLSVVLSVTTNYELKGYIVMHMPITTILNESMNFSDMLNICYLIFLGILLIIFIYIYFLTVIPLRKITKAAKEYSEGNFECPLDIHSQDQYEELAHSVIYMADELHNLDESQKKFVANISHDFRSPLTSIKGYAEAMQDGTIPPELYEKYFGIILFETERLTKLTTSLLSLNSFENNATQLEITSFDINHIIKKTAETFEGICLDKNIRLNLIFSEKNTYVNADMGKIQQVLYNLIDNAIKFSHPDSEIKIATEEKSEKVFVSVKDYGVGIPKENMKKVWERFYKTDASRGRDKTGTGLGLSITKEIINLHGENINLISTEGVGTEFIFSLEIAESH